MGFNTAFKGLIVQLISDTCLINHSQEPG